MADLEFSREGHVAHVRLNRPKTLNAISGEMNRRLLEAWTEINADPDIWVAVLSAEGEKALFTWFASRPIAQARAVVLTTLLPDDETLRAYVNHAIHGQRGARLAVPRS